MKGTIAIAAALLVVLGGLGLGHATARFDPKPPVIIGDDSVETRLDRMQRQLDAQNLEIAAVRNQNHALRAQVSNLIAINQHVSMESLHGRPTVRFSGVNVQVVNGMGRTGTANGTGNLIVGYDERREGSWLDFFEEECSLGDDGTYKPVVTKEECAAAGGTWQLDHKGGSHYVVVGHFHNYPNYGGLVAGWGNTASGASASVSGGFLNRAANMGTSVTGGTYGVARTYGSVVVGGDRNVAAGDLSVVSGGLMNIASGWAASVSGGIDNDASGTGASVSGGIRNKSTHEGASVSGGNLNMASGLVSSVSGGLRRTADDSFEWTAGSGED